MRHLTLSRWVALLTLAVALAPGTHFAAEVHTLIISGPFNMDELRQFEGTVGDDLGEIFARDDVHWWTLTLYDVEYSHDDSYYELYDEFGNVISSDVRYITRVHASAFAFQFHGADADILNQVVSSQLATVNLLLWNGYYFDPGASDSARPYSVWQLGLAPQDAAAGASFSAAGSKSSSSYAIFPADVNGYPVLGPRIFSDTSYITDYRPGNAGALVSYDDVVDIGSADLSLPPSLRILDGSALEGNKGTTRLDLTVTLSRSISDAVIVNYATANGTAQKKSDYTATSGTLTLEPGQISGTVSIAIKGDRKREKNETFSVQLSNAAGATINDGVATATILNDD